MLCCGNKTKSDLPEIHNLPVEKALQIYYNAKILPVERNHEFEHFYGHSIDDAEFDAKPTVMFMGEYSVGKTTMIKYLLGNEYPGSRVGPEPTTDKFIFISHSKNTREIPGPSLIADAVFPWKSMKSFGQDFLKQLYGAQFDSLLLQHINFIDTPGVLSGDKQQKLRNYDFNKVITFLADKVDRIYLILDVTKLDVSDEFKAVLQTVQGNEEKIKILLNKSDSVSSKDLAVIRGALMWNLGKVLKCAEVPKVFIGSYWDEPLKRDELEFKEVLLEDYRALLLDLSLLPRAVKVRKINDLVKRAKKLHIHVIIMDEMMARLRCACCFSESKRLEKASKPAKLAAIYHKMELKLRFTPQDLPESNWYQSKCRTSDWGRWNRLKKGELEMLTSFIDQDMPKVVNALPQDADVNAAGIQAMQETITQLSASMPSNLRNAAAEIGFTPIEIAKEALVSLHVHSLKAQPKPAVENEAYTNSQGETESTPESSEGDNEDV